MYFYEYEYHHVIINLMFSDIIIYLEDGTARLPSIFIYV